MARTSLRDRNPIVVGVVSLTVLGVATLVTFATGTLGLLDGGYTMTGIFADTGGLRSGNDVRVAGVRVGEVTEVRPDFKRTNVVVTWRVDSDVKLGRQTAAEIRMANVLGGRFVRLTGPVAAPYLDDLPERERTIPLARTQTPITVNEAVKTSTRAVSRLDTQTINKVLDELTGLSNQARGRLGSTLQKLTALTDTINENDPKIRELLNNADRVTQLVTSKDQELSSLLTSVQSLLGQLRERRAELATILGTGSEAVQGISRLINTHQNELIAIVKDLKTTLTALKPAARGLNSTLAWAGPTVSGIAGLGGYGPWAEAVVTGLGPISVSDLTHLPGAKPQSGSQGGRR